MKVGYTRVSRQDQRLEPQRDALLANGCERVFEEKISSWESDRQAVREAFGCFREGDVLVVARLDRLGRSLRTLIDLAGELEGRGISDPQGVAGQSDGELEDSMDEALG